MFSEVFVVEMVELFVLIEHGLDSDVDIINFGRKIKEYQGKQSVK
jgi:hypothetical protein